MNTVVLDQQDAGIPRVPSAHANDGVRGEFADRVVHGSSPRRPQLTELTLPAILPLAQT